MLPYSIGSSKNIFVIYGEGDVEIKNIIGKAEKLELEVNNLRKKEINIT